MSTSDSMRLLLGSWPTPPLPRPLGLLGCAIIDTYVPELDGSGVQGELEVAAYSSSGAAAAIFNTTDIYKQTRFTSDLLSDR